MILPFVVNLSANSRPVIEVPAPVLPKKENALYPELNSEPLTPSPMAPAHYGRLSFFNF